MAYAQPSHYGPNAILVRNKDVLEPPYFNGRDLHQSNIAEPEFHFFAVFVAKGRVEAFGDSAHHRKGPCSYTVQVLRGRSDVVFDHGRGGRTNKVEVPVFVNIVERSQAKFIARWVQGIVPHSLEVHVKIIRQVSRPKYVGE